MKKYIIPRADVLNLKTTTILSSSGDEPDAGETKEPVTDGGAAKSVVLFNFD